MPTLDWIGKKAVVNHHREVPYRLLHCDKALSAGDGQRADAGNLLVQGDNLAALKALLPYYAAQGKLADEGSRFRPVRTGVALRHLYPNDWQVDRYDCLLGNAAPLAGLKRGGELARAGKAMDDGIDALPRTPSALFAVYRMKSRLPDLLISLTAAATGRQCTLDRMATD
jgi:hypothetical protein